MFLSELKELTYSIYKYLNIKRPIRTENPDFTEELKNLAIINNWTSIDDWASNITQQILIDNGLSKVLYHYSIFEVPNILYPDQTYNILDMTLLPNKFWDKEGKHIKLILELYYKHHNNLPIDKELAILGIRKGVKKYGGISKLAKELNLIMYNSFKTIDGCIVRSRYEVIVSNFLHLNSIEYLYENNGSGD